MRANATQASPTANPDTQIIIGADTYSSVDTELIPTGHTEGDWTDEAFAYDNNIDSLAYYSVPASSWSPYLELTLSPTLIGSVILRAVFGAGEVTTIDIDGYYSGAYHHLYDGSFALGWNTLSFPAHIISKFQIRFQNTSSSEAKIAYVLEFHYASSARLVSYRLIEQPLGGQYIIELDNSDDALTAKQYEGKGVSVYLGFVSSTGSYLHTLVVEKQKFISEEGKLLMQLTCYDSLGKLSLFEGLAGGSIWNHPSQASAVLDQVVLPSGKVLPAALKTAILAQYDKTAWEIITAINTATMNVTITKDSQDDTALGLKPLVVAQDARSGIFQALRNTSTYPRLRTATAHIDFIKPDYYDVAYSFSVGNLFFNNTDERASVIPNKVVFHGIDVNRVLLTTATPHGENAASIALLGEVVEHNDYDPMNRENSTTQAVVDSKADTRLAKLVLSLGTGRFIAPMHCSLEMYDKVTLVDDRYETPKTITGYVFGIIREYGRGVYRIAVELGGVEVGYTPSRGSEAKIAPSAPQVTPGVPNVDWSAILPAAIQGFHTDVTFTSVDQDDITWTAGTIEFYDGTTQAIALGAYTLPTTVIYYIYFDLGDASPNVLKTTTDYLSVMDEQTGLICLAQKGSTANIKAVIIPSYGKQPLITPDFIDMSGLKSYDYGSGATLQAILSTQIQAGYLKLTADTYKNGEWYSQSGVILDASAGIDIYGTDMALTTSLSVGSITAFADAGGGEVQVTVATHGLSTGNRVHIGGTTNYNGNYVITVVDVNNFKITATWVANDAIGSCRLIQCYVGSDGKLYAGAGAIYLDISYLTLKGATLKFIPSDGGAEVAYIYGTDAGYVAIAPYTGTFTHLSVGVSIGAGTIFGLQLATGSDNILQWFDNAGTRNHAFVPETDDYGWIGQTTREFKGICALDFYGRGFQGVTDTIPSTFNNIYVNGGIITSWD